MYRKYFMSMFVLVLVAILATVLSPMPVKAVDQLQTSLWVTVTAPNGGEIMTVGDTYRITWDSPAEIDQVSIGYKSCPSCLNWIATNIPNTGYYDWSVFVGNTTNTQFTIYIIGYDTGTGSTSDTSDAPFTVLRPTQTPTPFPSPTPDPSRNITLITPNGGEVLIKGDTFRITWESSANIDKVTLGYKSCPSCLDWIANNIPNTGYYDWTVNVGNTTNTQFAIYIIGYETGVGSTTDTSDAAFTVLDEPPPPPLAVTLLTPNGGEVLTEGDIYRITWESTPEIDKVTLGFKSCPSCLDWIANDIPNTGYYDWTVYVGNTTNTEFTIEIIGYDTGVGSVIDYSDAPITVLQYLEPPVLLYPINGITIKTNHPTFDWEDVSGATQYTIQVSQTSDFSQILVNETVTNSTYVPVNKFKGTVYWRVQAHDAVSSSAWAQSSFKVK